MATNNIVMPINIRQNTNELSAQYGKYYAEVAQREALSTYGLAKHISKHASLVDENTLRLVLGQLAQCMVELISQGIPVKLEGLGTFRPTVQNVKGGVATVAEAQTIGADGMVEGVHIRFIPEGEDLRDVTYKQLKKQCSLRLENVVVSTPVYEEVDGVQKLKRRNRVFTPVTDYAWQQANAGGDGGSDGGDDDDEPDIRP